jgi:hypothetical protein
MDITGDDRFLIGKEHLDTAERYERESAEAALTLLGNGTLGKRAPVIYENLGTVLSLLSQLASCAWGCRGGGHDVENLVRRCCNYAFSALALARSGYYDEALAMVRGVAEVVNLLQAFTVDARHLRDWQTMPERDRRDRYGPVAVRKLIEESGKTPAVERETYTALCELGVHVTPNSMRTSHQHDGRVHVGGMFSILGFLLVLNELGICLSPAVVFAGQLVNLPADRVRELVGACNELRRHCTTYARAANYLEVLAGVQSGNSGCD